MGDRVLSEGMRCEVPAAARHAWEASTKERLAPATGCLVNAQTDADRDGELHLTVFSESDCHGGMKTRDVGLSHCCDKYKEHYV